MSNSSVSNVFFQRYQRVAEICIASPGRINIIGEHTDYTGGYVLPAAVDFHITLALAKRDDLQCRIYSIDFDEQITVNLPDIVSLKSTWANYILGVAVQLRDNICGFDMVFAGDIPVGAGLSSSAALCCGVSMGLTQLYDITIDSWGLARMAQRSENDFVGLKCGIMDQFACVFGRKNEALLLNCSTLEYTSVPIVGNYQWLLFNSNVPHQLDDSAYNERYAESHHALDMMKEAYPDITSYLNVTMAMLSETKNLSARYYHRARHIVTENQRVLLAGDAFRNGDVGRLGMLLNDSHESLRSDYEVTCAETDFLVTELNTYQGILGARQMGGGFGGCVIALSSGHYGPEMLKELSEKYGASFGKELTEIPVRISEGCHETGS